MDNEYEVLKAAYRDFNARQLEAVLSRMTSDVQWPNGWEGGYVHGHEGVRDYWTRQWAVINPKVEPDEIRRLEDGRFAVEVHQTVHDREGNLLVDQRVRHLYRMRNGLIERMDIEEVLS
jgi:hypothetical protein